MPVSLLIYLVIYLTGNNVAIKERILETTLHEMLRSEGINPKEVSLLRHQTRRYNGKTIYQFRQSDLVGFELYQSAQESSRPVFSRPRYWASFVVDPAGRTIFAGLYGVSRLDGEKADWLDPFTGRIVGAGTGKKYDVYETNLSPILNSHIDELEIDWDRTAVRSWARHAVNADWKVRSIAHASQLGFDHEEDPTGAKRRLLGLGFEETYATKKLWKMERNGLVLYVKKNTKRLSIVMHPWLEAKIGEILLIPEVSLESPFKYYINSNLTDFPLYHADNRETSSRYGIALAVATSASAEALVAYLDANRQIDTPDGPVIIQTDQKDPIATDREALSLARIGQGLFRQRLIERWSGKCAVTGIDQIEALCASHIKPWAISSNSERLDKNNGLLLSAHFDRLFDRYLISFDVSGNLLVSKRLSLENLQRFGISLTGHTITVSPEMQIYLKHHNTIFHEGST